jgi:hypothetical protein
VSRSELKLRRETDKLRGAPSSIDDLGGDEVVQRACTGPQSSAPTAAPSWRSLAHRVDRQDGRGHQRPSPGESLCNQVATDRAVDDIGDQAPSYAEVKALATGNPLILEKAAIDAEVARLRLRPRPRRAPARPVP